MEAVSGDDSWAAFLSSCESPPSVEGAGTLTAETMRRWLDGLWQPRRPVIPMPGTEPQTYDLTRADYAFSPADDGQRGHIACWNGLAPRPGDYLILRNGARSTRYQVTASDLCFGVDPPTMWMADLAFAPRPGGEP